MLEEFEVLQVKEKVGMLAPDTWMINSYCEVKDYYRVQLANSDVYRPIGIVDRKELEEAISNGTVVLKGLLKKHRPKKEKK